MYSSYGPTFAGEKNVHVNGMDGYEKILFENLGVTVRVDLFLVNELLYTISFRASFQLYDQYAESSTPSPSSEP